MPSAVCTGCCELPAGRGPRRKTESAASRIVHPRSDHVDFTNVYNDEARAAAYDRGMRDRPSNFANAV